MDRHQQAMWAAVVGAALGGWWLSRPSCTKAAGPPGAGGAAPAQFAQARRTRNAAADGEESTLLDGVFLPPPRKVKLDLQKVRELLDAGRYEDSVEFLGNLLADQVLDGSEDYFFRPDPTQSVYRSLKAEAARLVARLPQAGRERYELLFGYKARDMLAQAVAQSDAAALAEISRRYLGTKAGCEATLLLARHYLDHSQPLAAALCYQRVREVNWAAERYEPELSLALATCWARAGMRAKAEEVLRALRQSHAASDVQIAGRKVALFAADGDALAWLERNTGGAVLRGPAAEENWTMFRGDAARNAVARGGRPLLNRRWSQDAFEHPATGRAVQQMRQGYLDQNTAALPAMHPLAVGNVVLMRSARFLWAVDFATGKRIWSYPNPDAVLSDADELVPTGQAGGQPTNVFRAIEQRFWEDGTFGTLSSDGARVFVVEESERAGNRGLQVIDARGVRRGFGGPRPFNRLRALELASEGKLAWQVGDSHGLDEPQLAGAYFLGPPLPLLDRVYALAEFKGEEIRLVCLSAKSGALEWSQQLARVEQSVMLDPYRRSAGLTPSFADGVLVCPTASGAVVAVDLATRNLLWGYQYPRKDPERPVSRVFNRGNVFLAASPERRVGVAWADGSVTCAGGKVIVTPIESDQLLCLSLVDGSLAWKANRGKNLYVAAVHGGAAVLVGQSEVTALKLADGSAAWQQPLELSPGVMPSGRGFATADSYFLPLTSAEVVQFNLATGQIEGRAKSRSGQIPGNLVAFRGDIISQAPDRVDVFHQVEPLRVAAEAALAAKPNDAVALTQLGEIKLDEGAIGEAIALLDRSYALANDELTRQLLVESVLAGLAQDFPAHRATAQRLAPLIDQERQRPRYLRLVAQGLLAAGETRPAVDALLALADLDDGRHELQEVDGLLSVRRDRWLAARLADLRAQAAPELAAHLEGIVAERLAAALADGSPAALRKFLDLFAHERAADAAREQLAALRGAAGVLERELLLLELIGSGEDDRARAAAARLAELFRETGQNDLAAAQYRQLLARWADVPCLDGRTARQLADALPAQHPLRGMLVEPAAWPLGLVKAELGGTRTLGEARQQRALDVELRGNAGPYLSRVTVALDNQLQTVFGLDAFGREAFRVGVAALLANQLSGDRQFDRQMLRRLQLNGGVLPNAVNVAAPALNYGVARGHLLLLSVGYQVLAIDALAPGGAERGDAPDPRVLWVHELSENIPGADTRIVPRPLNVGWGLVRYVGRDARGPLGTMSPIRAWGACYQRYRDLVCVHPLTGQVQWVRRGVPQGCDVFADDERLVVCPSDAGEALILRGSDGQLLGRRRVPGREQRMTGLGTALVLWTHDGGKPQISLYDPLADRTVWSHAFELNTKAALAEPDVVAAVEPGGKLWILELANGRALVAGEPVEPEKQMNSVFLLASSSQLLVATNGPLTNRTGRSRNAIAAPTGLNCNLINGRLYAFDRATGKRLWGPTTIEQQGLLLRQPAESPILVFARHAGAAPGRSTPAASVWCLDRRTGEIVYPSPDKRDQEFPWQISNLEVLADRADSTVSVLLPGDKTVTLRLTDEPIPPPPPKPPDNAGLGPTLNSVLRAFGVPVDGNGP